MIIIDAKNPAKWTKYPDRVWDTHDGENWFSREATAADRKRRIQSAKELFKTDKVRVG